MPTVNRFPLLGLWAQVAARRLGYTKGQAESLGHAYAVLYAIRAAKPGTAHKEQGNRATKPRKKKGLPEEQITFGGDQIDVVHDAKGHIQGHVGHDSPQTARSYEASVRDKFPPGYYDRLDKAFREVLRGVPPRALEGERTLYNLYDNWKKSCAVGRLVDLDCLLKWCRERRSAPVRRAKP
jgi:hypothetical protein